MVTSIGKRDECYKHTLFFLRCPFGWHFILLVRSLFLFFSLVVVCSCSQRNIAHLYLKKHAWIGIDKQSNDRHDFKWISYTVGDIGDVSIDISGSKPQTWHAVKHGDMYVVRDLFDGNERRVKKFPNIKIKIKNYFQSECIFDISNFKFQIYH